jgi:hypothetical protein
MGSYRPLLITTLLAAACGGGQMTSSYLAASPSPTPEVFACVRKQLKVNKFDQTSMDVSENRVNGRKFDETVRRPDVTFRRLVDRLEIEVAPGAGGDTVSTLSINARTFAETVNQRGPTETQEKTSQTAQAASQAIVDSCSHPVDSLAVPG